MSSALLRQRVVATMISITASTRRPDFFQTSTPVCVPYAVGVLLLS